MAWSLSETTTSLAPFSAHFFAQSALERSASFLAAQLASVIQPLTVVAFAPAALSLATENDARKATVSKINPSFFMSSDLLLSSWQTRLPRFPLRPLSFKGGCRLQLFLLCCNEFGQCSARDSGLEYTAPAIFSAVLGPPEQWAGYTPPRPAACNADVHVLLFQ